MRKFIYILIGLLYFLSPIDLLPDFAGLMGRVDDLLVIFFLYWQYKKHFQEKIEQLKREFLGEKKKREQQKSSGQEQQALTPHQVLGVSTQATQKELRKAYRALVTKYHPDKVSHLGEEFQKLAHEKMLEIQNAYKKLSEEQA